MSGHDGSAFFIGWNPGTARPLARFLACVGAPCALLFVALAFGLSASAGDPGGGDFDWAAGDKTLSGVLTAEPYPMLRMPPDAAHPAGHTILLAGDGKRAPNLATGENGSLVSATGVMLHRGDIGMMQVGELRPSANTNASGPPARDLGRWRVVGEICDGKCYMGAMRPGTGLAHRACASLCIFGGLPPVLVATGPIEGEEFLLLADPDGHPVPDSVRDLIAVPVALEGEVERRGDLLILRTDLSRARRL